MILTVVVSYKRQKLLERTLESYVETVTLPHKLVIVDNGSEPKTIKWLKQLRNVNHPVHPGKVQIILLGENRFPGYATNVGWDQNDGHEFLHRSDNDVEYLPGWCDEVTRCFDADPSLGQLGLRTVEEEGAHPNVGGNCVVRAEVFEKVRWVEDGWRPGVKGEDYFFSTAVTGAGYTWTRVSTPCIIHRGAQWPDRPSSDAYYVETNRAKGFG